MSVKCKPKCNDRHMWISGNLYSTSRNRQLSGINYRANSWFSQWSNLSSGVTTNTFQVTDAVAIQQHVHLQ